MKEQTEKIVGRIISIFLYIFVVSFLVWTFYLVPIIPLTGVAILGRILPVYNDCDILPKNTNYKIILSHTLYNLTKKGLIEKGGTYGIDDPIWKLGHPGRFVFGSSQRAVYFPACTNSDNFLTKGARQCGVYKIKLYEPVLKPELVLNTDNGWANLSISPGGNLLLFHVGTQPNNLNLLILDLTTGKQQQITNEFDWYTTAWVNDHQFIYGNEVIDTSETKKLFLFDLNAMTKKDLHMDNCTPGAVTPDGNQILLACDNKTVFYDISDGTTKVLVNKWMNLNNMIWLSDGKGFLYTDAKWRDFGDGPDGGTGLYYYSLKKKKSVRLMRLFSLYESGGFIVPQNLNIQLPDTPSNRIVASPKFKNRDMIKVCN